MMISMIMMIRTMQGFVCAGDVADDDNNDKSDNNEDENDNINNGDNDRVLCALEM